MNVDQQMANFFCESQIINILGFATHTPYPYPEESCIEAAVGSMSTSGPGYSRIKLYMWTLEFAFYVIFMYLKIFLLIFLKF